MVERRWMKGEVVEVFGSEGSNVFYHRFRSNYNNLFN